MCGTTREIGTIPFDMRHQEFHYGVLSRTPYKLLCSSYHVGTATDLSPLRIKLVSLLFLCPHRTISITGFDRSLSIHSSVEELLSAKKVSHSGRTGSQMDRIAPVVKKHGYTPLRKVGSGSFGQAWLVGHQNEHGKQEQYVCKMIDISRCSKKEKNDALHEASVLRDLKHPYVV